MAQAPAFQAAEERRSARLTAIGRGDREPLDRADTAAAKARNRRVELIIPRSQ